MKQFITPAYTFTPGASGVGTVNLSGISSFNVKYLVSIINQTRGIIIYSTASTTLRYTNVAGTTVTLFSDTTGQSGGDILQVIYDEAALALSVMTKSDGTTNLQQATENGATNIGNAYKKFRDGFSSLAQGAAPDSSIWDIAWANQGSSSIGRAGNAQGSSYMKISMCPITVNSELTMTTRETFKFPMRFIHLLSLSQRVVGQEFEVSIVGVDGSGVIETLTPKADLAISGTISVTTNVATINFATDHGLRAGDRVLLAGNTESRINVGPVAVTVITPTQITIPLTIANAAYAAGGVVVWADPFTYAKNGAGLLYENAASTNATFVARRNGFNTRQVNSTIVTTANAAIAPYSDPFNATSMCTVISNQEEFTIIPRSPDTVLAPGAALKYTQGIPDEEIEYKIRIRAKNNRNFTRLVGRIVSATKAGSTTCTITTDTPHNLTTTSFVQMYGVRDTVNFPNTATGVVTSVISATQFTIISSPSATASSAGGGIFLNEGSIVAPGVSAVVIQSLSRTNNVMSAVGNTTWTLYLPGETVHLYGTDATSLGLYDGAYKVLRINTTILELESVGADFGSINSGGAVVRRTDLRVHAVSQVEHTKLIAELSNAQGSADISKSLPVVITSAGITLTTATTGNVGLITHLTVADIASAALTTTTTTATTTPGLGQAYQVSIPVTAVSGTTPTLDIAIEESTDAGINWFKVYDFPRITATGFYNSPILRLRGTRLRYVQTVAGTTPSFTRAINRSQINGQAPQIVQIIDRTIVPNTLNSVSPAILVEGCQEFNITARVTVQSTPATIALQFSTNGVDYHTGPLTIATAVGVVHAKVSNEQWKFARLIVSVAGTGITLGEVSITGVGK